MTPKHLPRLATPLGQQPGFALILAITLMAFMLLTLLSLTALVQSEATASENHVKRTRAQLNARYGMSVALSQLQRYAGQDQRVTASGAIADPSPNTDSHDVPNPYWMGVWDTTHPDGDDADPVVLISGNEEFNRLKTDNSGQFANGSAPGSYYNFNTAEASVAETVTLINNTVGGDADLSVWAPKVALSENDGQSGNYAWWVGDEGIKAKVNVRNKHNVSEDEASDFGFSDLETRNLTASLFISNRNAVGFALDPSESDLLPDDPLSGDLLPDDPQIQNMMTLSDLQHFTWPYSVQAQEAHQTKYHDLTAYGYGLLTDVRNGGFKHDLTVAFDTYENYAHIFPENNNPSAEQHMRCIFDPDVISTVAGMPFPGQASYFPYFDTLLDYYQLPIQIPELGAEGGLLSGHMTSSGNGAETMPRPYGNPDRFIYEDTAYSGNRRTSHQLLYNQAPYNTPTLRYNHANKLGLISARQQMNIWIRYVQYTETDPISGVSRTRYKPMIGRQPIHGFYNPYNFHYRSNGSQGIAGTYSKSTYYPNIVIRVNGKQPVAFNLSEIRIADDNNSNLVYRFSRRRFGDPFEVGPGETRLFSPQLRDRRGWLDPMGMEVPFQQAWNERNVIWTDLLGQLESPYHIGKFGHNVVRFDGEDSGGPTGTYNIDDSLDYWSTGKSLVEFNKDYNLDAPPAGAWGGWGRGAAPRPQDPSKMYYGFTQDELERLIVDDPIGTIEVSVDLSEMGGVLVNTHTNWNANVQRLEAPIRPGYSITDKLIGDPVTEGLVHKTFNISSELTSSTGMLVYGFASQLRPANYPDDTEPVRGLVDFNIRPSVGRAEYEGANDLTSAGTGLRTCGLYGFAEDNLITPTGEVTAMRPPTQDPGPAMATVTGGWRLEWAGLGITQAPLFDIPRTPLLSVGQFQHAQLSNWSNQPTYAFGNSFRPYQLRRDNFYTTVPRESDNSAYPVTRVFDTSYLLNERIWDQYFFSTLSRHDPGNRSSMLNGTQPLAVSRYEVKRGKLEPNNLDWNQLTGVGGGQSDVIEAFDTTAARLFVNGAFNVNSTSVDAWKAVLAHLNETSLPVYDYHDTDPSLNEYNMVAASDRPVAAFSRFFTPTSSYAPGDDLADAYNGYRELSENELNSLAEEIVKEVKARGPFLSLADFVNRAETPGVSQSLAAYLGSTGNHTNETSMLSTDSRNAGALQSAILRSDINDHAENTLSYNTVSNSTYNGASPDPVSGATGLLYPGDLSQADVLQSLAPVISARSDTFTIRSYGEYINPVSGEVESEAWCEAVVQRMPEPANAPDSGYTTTSDYNDALRNLHVQGNTNFSEFGRKFRVISFRWLSQDDV